MCCVIVYSDQPLVGSLYTGISYHNTTIPIILKASLVLHNSKNFKYEMNWHLQLHPWPSVRSPGVSIGSCLQGRHWLLSADGWVPFWQETHLPSDKSLPSSSLSTIGHIFLLIIEKIKIIIFWIMEPFELRTIGYLNNGIIWMKDYWLSIIQLVRTIMCVLTTRR